MINIHERARARSYPVERDESEMSAITISDFRRDFTEMNAKAYESRDSLTRFCRIWQS